MSFSVGHQKELLGTLSKSGRQGRILLDRSVGDHSVPAAPAITPTILQVELNYLSLSFLYFNHHPTIVQLDLNYWNHNYDSIIIIIVWNLQ